MAGVFVGGGVNAGFTDTGRLFIQFQASGSVGVGIYGGVGVAFGANRPVSELPGGYSVDVSPQANANAGLFESVGVSGTYDSEGSFGISGSPLVRVGAGLGAQASVGPVQTVTFATQQFGLLRRLFGRCP